MHPTVRALVDAWDWSYVDFDAAFDGLQEEHLHQRPSPALLSISELAAHTIYSEASIILRYLLGIPKNQWGPEFYFRDPFGWPPDILSAPTDSRLIEMDVVQVRETWRSEHQRILSALDEFDLPAGHRFHDEWAGPAPDVETRLRFAAYHVAYHIGQIYMVRQLLGEATPDN